MKTINGYTPIFLTLMLGIATLFLFSCGAVDEDDMEQLLQAEEAAETDHADTHIHADDTDEPIGLEMHTFTVDATDENNWAYFSFEAGDTVAITDAENSNAWDLGFQRTRVKINGGISGPGEGGVVMLTETDFASVTAAPADGYLSDTADTLAIVPQSEKGWYIYTGPPTHWVLPLEDRVFVIKAADGTFAKVRFTGYYEDNENKQNSGFMSFEFVHQPDGSLNF